MWRARAHGRGSRRRRRGPQRARLEGVMGAATYHRVGHEHHHVRLEPHRLRARRQAAREGYPGGARQHAARPRLLEGVLHLGFVAGLGKERRVALRRGHEGRDALPPRGHGPGGAGRRGPRGRVGAQPGALCRGRLRTRGGGRPRGGAGARRAGARRLGSPRARPGVAPAAGGAPGGRDGARGRRGGMWRRPLRPRVARAVGHAVVVVTPARARARAT
mmetsp:Transcript_142/g.483  ORF Transcript_142/g.483 Transcript_142/m.483 type:complete len:218 (+) Transcript_142:128-781(+)